MGDRQGLVVTKACLQIAQPFEYHSRHQVIPDSNSPSLSLCMLDATSEKLETLLFRTVRIYPLTQKVTNLPSKHEYGHTKC